MASDMTMKFLVSATAESTVSKENTMFMMRIHTSAMATVRCFGPLP